MKILTLLAAVLAFSVQTSIAQLCPLLYKDGNKLNLTVKTWTNPLISDVKFLKAKDEKKEEQVKALNAEIASGKVQPNKYSFVYTVKKEETADDALLLTTVMGGKEYVSRTACSNDTIHFYRSLEPAKMESNDQILGYTIFGVQKIPVNIKVGDMLPKYEDVGILFPTTTDKSVRVRLFSHYDTKTKTDVTTYQSGHNEVTTETRKQTFLYPVYNDIDATVRQTLSVSSHFINYMVALVTAKENIAVNGKEYTAFVIDSEWWTKLALKTSYEAANKEVAKAQQALIEQAQESIAKRLHKKWGFTNEHGYAVYSKKEWFVPELGIVKTQTFDQYGALQSETIIDSIE